MFAYRCDEVLKTFSCSHASHNCSKVTTQYCEEQGLDSTYTCAARVDLLFVRGSQIGFVQHQQSALVAHQLLKLRIRR